MLPVLKEVGNLYFRERAEPFLVFPDKGSWAGCIGKFPANCD